MATNTAVNVLAEARKEVGYVEQPKGSNVTKFAPEAGHPNRQPWCASFISAILIRCHVLIKGNNVLVPSSRTMYANAKKNGWAVPVSALRPGDVIHNWRGLALKFWKGHVAFVVRVILDKKGRIVSVVTIEGNALPLDTPVLTPSGFKAIGGLVAGDAVVDPMGEPSHVAAIYDHTQRDVYRLSLSDGRTIDADGEHLWAIDFGRQRTPKVASTMEIAAWLKEGQTIGIQRPISAFEFGQQASGLEWIVGYLIGNGCSSSGHVTMNALDEEVVAERFARIGCPLSKWRQVLGGGVTRGVGPNLTRRLNITGRSWEKSIPPEFLNVDAEGRKALLAGLLDSDGTADTFGRVSFSSSSRTLAEQVLWLVRSLGGTAGWYENHPMWTSPAQPEQQQGRRQHRVANIRFDFGYQPFTFDRKGERLRERAMTRGYSFTSVEKVGRSDTRCITVTASSALYVAGDFIITHNTDRSGSPTGGMVLEKTRAVAWWRIGAWRPPYAA